MTQTLRFALAAAAMIAATQAAEAQTLIGPTANNALVRIDGTTGEAAAPVRICRRRRSWTSRRCADRATTQPPHQGAAGARDAPGPATARGRSRQSAQAPTRLSGIAIPFSR